MISVFLPKNAVGVIFRCAYSFIPYVARMVDGVFNDATDMVSWIYDLREEMWGKQPVSIVRICVTLGPQYLESVRMCCTTESGGRSRCDPSHIESWLVRNRMFNITGFAQATQRNISGKCITSGPRFSGLL